MNDTKVTVVVPVYKTEKYLDRCIGSIVSQTYRDLEIILVDDGSPDRCGEMCDAWAEKDSRVKVVHKKNAGLGMARNSGMEAATGDYICFVDSDDYIDATTVEEALRTAASHGAQIVVFGMTRVNAREEPVRQVIPATCQSCYRDDAVRDVFLPDLIDPEHRDAANQGLILSSWSALYSMDLVKRTGWRFVSEREIISEDSYSLIWLYSHVQSVAVLPEALYFYCENGGSLTQTYRADRFEKIKHFHRVCTEMAIRQGFDQKICTRISGLFLAFSIAAMKQIAGAQLPRKERSAMIAQIIDDDVTQRILADPDCRYRSRARIMLFRAMRSRMYGLVYCLAKLQLFRDRK